MALGASFESVLTGAREGAEWAWSRLYDDLAGPVRGYLARQGAADPDNLLGDVFLHLARRIKEFRGEEPAFRSWVFMIAHHRVIDERRSRRRKPAEPSPTSDIEQHTAPVRSAEDDVMERLSGDWVQQILDRLTPDQREVLTLRIIEGFGITEIGEIMGKRPGAVQALQHRALRAVRKQLDQSVWVGETATVTEMR